MTQYKDNKPFSEEREPVSEAGRKGQGMIRGNMKRDTGRAVNTGHRSNQNRIGGDDR